MINKSLIWILIIVAFSSCYKKRDHDELKEMLKSNDVEKIIDASNCINKNKDTSLVSDLLENALDPRISHDLRYNGMSVFKVKMYVMRDLTSVEPQKILPIKRIH